MKITYLDEICDIINYDITKLQTNRNQYSINDYYPVITKLVEYIIVYK